MKYADSTFIVDYLTEPEGGPVGEYLESVEEMYTPALCLYEVYRGALFMDDGTTVDDLKAATEWFSPVPCSRAAALDAARIEQELRDAGTPINQLDILIAGVVREVGGTLVTTDSDFEAVPGLTVESY